MMAAAIVRLPELARAIAESQTANDAPGFDAFFDALERDARVSLAAIRLVLSRSDISSQIVDNLNASIHLRALLTDIFLIDEALRD